MPRTINHECLSVLLKNGADADRAANSGATAVFISAQKNHHECLSVLLLNGADSDRATNSGATAVYISAQENSHKCMSLLLVSGADASKAKNDGVTPLHSAANNNSFECVILLLLPQYGVAVDAVTALGQTALWRAAYHGHQLIAELLVQGRANIDIAANNGMTAIDIAREQGHTALVRYLDAESKWRRRGPLIMVLSSIRCAQFRQPVRSDL